MAIDTRFLEDVKERINLADLVGRKVRLARKGRDHTGLCPFHHEKTPSFTVNDQKGFYHCFGCGAHGGAIDFVMNTEGLGFLEAVERLAGEAGLTMPKPDPESRAKAESRKSLSDIMAQATAWYQARLKASEGKAAADYLKKRGLSAATITRYKIGYAPDDRYGLTKELKSQGVEEHLLVEAGLSIKPEGGGAIYDRFRGRVMFPIEDRQNRVIAFGGRALAEQTASGQKLAKYLNSPETSLFHKGAVLYNWARAREAAFKTGELLVVEGYMDVIGLGAAGIDHAVAPLGTALTEEQMAHLWQMADEPILAFDGDQAGIRAALRALERALPLLKPGKSFRFLSLPQGEDPDSLVRMNGRSAMEKLMDGAQSLVDILWLDLWRDHHDDTPERQAGLEKKIAARLALIEDETVRRLYQRAFRDRLWEKRRPQKTALRQKTFKSAFQKPSLERYFMQAGEDPSRMFKTVLGCREGTEAVTEGLEKLLLLCLCHHPEILVKHEEAVAQLEIRVPALQKLQNHLLDFATNAAHLSRERFYDYLNGGDSQKIAGKDSTISSNNDMQASLITWEMLKQDLPRKAYWSAWPEADLSDALTLFEHGLKRYHFATTVKKDYEKARADYEADMTEACHQRFLAAQKAFLALEETKATIEGYGLSSNKIRS